MFSALQKYHGDILNTGMNSETKEELAEDLAELLEGENGDDGVDYRNIGLPDLLNILDCDVIEHKTPFASSFMEI